jgi:hypothetical protein
MPASQDTYTRRQGLKQTYQVEYTSLRYKISLHGKVLKETQLPIQAPVIRGPEAAWNSAVSDIEYLRGMRES